MSKVSPGEDAAQPLEILYRNGPVQSVSVSQSGKQGLAGFLSRSFQLGGIGGNVVSGRQLNQKEGHQGDNQECGYKEEQTAQQELQHQISTMAGAKKKKAVNRIPIKVEIRSTALED
jgi:hypothetical protein